MRPQDESLEATFSQARKDLELVRNRLVAIQGSIERCEQDKLSTWPPAPLYQRPKSLPTDC